jgi:hypothetical protein
MHYNLNGPVDTSSVDLNESVFGLVPIYFPSYDTAAFAELVGRCIRETTAAIEEWAGT